MKKLLLLMLAVTYAFTLKAQDSLYTSANKPLELSLRAGFSMGGSTPIGFPVAIRKISRYNPGMMLAVEAAAHYRVTARWGLLASLLFEQKGMSTEAMVKGYYTTFNSTSGNTQSVTGYFTGSVSTEIKTSYMTIPLSATYQPRNCPWLRLKGGGYFSYALERKFIGDAREGYMRNETPVGERVDISAAAYDFSDDIRAVNIGAMLGADYFLNRHLLLASDLSYGITPLMKPDFKSVSFEMHHLFLRLSFGYRF